MSLDFLIAFLTALFFLPLAKVASWKEFTIRIHPDLSLLQTQHQQDIAIATMLLITFQEPRMKTPAVKSARMPAQRMKGFQLSKFAACIRQLCMNKMRKRIRRS